MHTVKEMKNTPPPKKTKFKKNSIIKSLSLLLMFWIFGFFLVIITFQLADSYTAKSKSDEYANELLHRANDVYYSVKGAIDYLNDNKNDQCGDILRNVSYDFRFIEDAGRIDGYKIICSAMSMENRDIILNKNNLIFDGSAKIWDDVTINTQKKHRFRMISRGGSFVVVSPNAFNAYSNPPHNTIGRLNNKLDGFTYYKFGSDIPDQWGFVMESTVCSESNFYCANTSTYSNILKNSRWYSIIFYILTGIVLGQAIKYLANVEIERKRSMPYRLRLAIERELLSVAYQPIVLASSGEIKGFEVLARWNDKELGKIPPDTFIKEAERVGLYEKLSENIITKAIDEMTDILKNNKLLYISINLKTHEIVSFEIINKLLTLLKKNGIPSSQVAIEILESSTSNLGSIERSIIEIKSLGFGVFIDDFGTGYSSLSYLSGLKVDKIKIDKTFTQSAGTDSPASFVLFKICEIANRINSLVIFEGVETPMQREAIISNFPNALAQGWLYSKAIDISDVKKILKNI